MSEAGEQFVVHHYYDSHGGVPCFWRAFESLPKLLHYLASERGKFSELRVVDGGDFIVAQTIKGVFTWPLELVKLQTDFSEEEILSRFKKAVADEEILDRLKVAAQEHEVP